MPKRIFPRAQEPLPLLRTYSRRRWYGRIALEAGVVLLAIAFVLVALGSVFGHG